jgi:cohesin complex subunit SA-1/2
MILTIALRRQDKDEDAQSQIGRAVIDALPRLFAKHQTHPARIVDVLAIPRLIALEQYHQLTRVDVRPLLHFEEYAH